MKFIIIGVTGLIGSRLASFLVSKGNQVTGLSRNPDRLSADFPFLTEKIFWNGNDPQSLAHIIEGADVVVNLAGESIAGKRWSAGQKQKIITSRKTTTLAVAEAFRLSAKPPETLIQASATGYYEPASTGFITESSGPGDHFLSEVCRVWEGAAGNVRKVARLIIIRTGVVLDNKGGALPQMLMPFRFFAGGHIGNGRQVIPWIHIQDEIEAIRFLATRSTASGIYNLTAPEPVTMKIFAKMTGKVLKSPSWLHVPGFALKILMGKMAQELLLDSYPVIPERLLEEDFHFRFPSLENALNNLLT